MVAFKLMVLVALAGLTAGQFNRRPFNQGRFNQGQVNQGTFSQGQVQQSHFSQDRVNQGQVRQNQFTQGQVSQVVRQSLQPRQPPVAIIYDEREGPVASGAYSFRYESADGSRREESATPTGPKTFEVRGSYSYIAEDGTQVEVTYVADENGYRAESPILPTPPAMPAHALQQIAAAEEAFARKRQEEQRQGFQGQQNFQQQNFQGQQNFQQQNFQQQNFQEQQNFQQQNLQDQQNFQQQNFQGQQNFQQRFQQPSTSRQSFSNTRRLG